ncbi:hypothetical protein HanOQP8_Chr16g0626351 [Helianthus annuus]|nr:hypothetical protein HanHA89_Chr16g0671301 [Helianthus annuus]KAJ0641781.1 hypothetical protein HanLR1_Chr16g0630981 [Helianthus annuus]KAJ0645660.1 hypothetical protein HanOQP8_Chr16g0626351 [Helianthus annuus]
MNKSKNLIELNRRYTAKKGGLQSIVFFTKPGDNNHHNIFRFHCLIDIGKCIGIFLRPCEVRRRSFITFHLYLE